MILMLLGVMMVSGCVNRAKLNQTTLEDYNAGNYFYAARWHDSNFSGYIGATKATCPDIIEQHKVTEAYIKLYWDLEKEITALAVDGIEGDDLYEINSRKLKRRSISGYVPNNRDYLVSQRASENCQLMAEGKIPNTEPITDW